MTVLRESLGYDALKARFRPVFDRIAEGAVHRERQRELPHREVAWLREAGFGAVRVPVEHGGSGASLPELFELLVELAEADSNLPQLLRAHVLSTEHELARVPSADRDRWLREIAGGALFGNATSETGAHRVDELHTTLTERDGELVLDGTKYYCTGSLFADWITVRAQHAPGDLVALRIPATAPGVQQYDDWNGFGQRTTGSGTARFDEVHVEAADVGDYRLGPTAHTGLAQLVLLACLVGVGRAAAGDATRFVRARDRSYSHASADLPRHDPLVQQVVGSLHSSAFAAHATLRSAVRSMQRAQLAEADREQLLVEAEIAVSEAHVAILDLVLPAVNRLFDVGGASVVSSDRALDRHWRNARTLAVHNPVIYKAREVGDHEINGSEPVFTWTPGVSAGDGERKVQR